MESKLKTFVDALSAPPQKPTGRPSPWEKYLLEAITNLQKENKELNEALTATKNKIIELEDRIAKQETKPEETPAPLQQHEVETHNQVSNETFPINKENLVQDVISKIKEEERIEQVAKCLRVGGIQEDWHMDDVFEPEEIENDTYISETEVMRRKIARAVPFVDLGDPYLIEAKGKHVQLWYLSKEEKSKVMRQSKSLKGTKVWLADELTPLQLRDRKKELAKVAEARKHGKWAVYRGGKAIIEEFRKPKKNIASDPVFP